MYRSMGIVYGYSLRTRANKGQKQCNKGQKQCNNTPRQTYNNYVTKRTR